MQKYDMKCIRCQSNLIYIENIEMEKLGWISFQCSNCNEKMQDILVPNNNPDLVKNYGKDLFEE